MSMSYTVIVGPYAYCESKAVEVPTGERACVRAKCPRKGKVVSETTKHCPECGSAPKDTGKTERRSSVDHWQLMDDIEDALTIVYDEWEVTSPDHIIWVANVARPGNVTRRFNARAEHHKSDLTGLDTRAEIEAFRAAFAPELAVLAGRYDSVSLRWGVLSEIC